MLLTAAWSIVLARASGQRDVVLGTVVAGRRAAVLEDLIGPFLNTLPLRVRLRPAATFRDLVRDVRETMLDALAHQDLPFEQLVEALRPPRQLGRHPIFQAMVVLQNTPASRLELPDVRGTMIERATTVAKHDVTLTMVETNGAIAASISTRERGSTKRTSPAGRSNGCRCCATSLRIRRVPSGHWLRSQMRREQRCCRPSTTRPVRSMHRRH